MVKQKCDECGKTMDWPEAAILPDGRIGYEFRYALEGRDDIRPCCSEDCLAAFESRLALQA